MMGMMKELLDQRLDEHKYELLDICKELEKASSNVVVAFNSLGESCPSSIVLVAERARAVIKRIEEL